MDHRLLAQDRLRRVVQDGAAVPGIHISCEVDGTGVGLELFLRAAEEHQQLSEEDAENGHVLISQFRQPFAVDNDVPFLLDVTWEGRSRRKGV